MMTHRLVTLATVLLTISALAVPASATFPHSGGDASDPYAYEDYMFTAEFPPSDLGGDIWKYSSKTACDLYGQFDPRCNPLLINSNPQELFGVTGASIDLAWRETTGRPDVVIAVHDSGIKWNDRGAMIDLINKTWLNTGELPEPDWGVRDPAHPYDRNFDGAVNFRDFCPEWEDPRDCGGAGDSRVRGSASTPDTDFNANGFLDPEDLIFLFSDGADDDSNGYDDDFVGWDSYEDDNDPFDEVQFGHGTGEARDSAAEINNGGDAGVCPNCMVMHMRVGDSFIADVNDFAEGVVYATDNGASVIQSALGTLNNSRFAQEAIDYAYRRGVVLIASAADESAGHHNQPSVLEHAVTVNSIGEPELPGAIPAQPSYLEFRGCTNFGAYITAAVPSNSCSSEATGRSAGMAGLAYAAGRNGVATGAIADYGVLDGPGGVPAGRGLSAEEIDQLISTTADDLNFTTPLLYHARPFPETERYPATAGWDPFFGYGRINATRIVRAVSSGMVPPEADITSPRWFEIRDPGAGTIQVRGRAAALRAPQFSYTVQWAPWSWREINLDPAYTTEGVNLALPGNNSAPARGLLATIDPEAIERALVLLNGPAGTSAGPAADSATGRGDHENRQIPDKFGIIVRLEVTARDAAGEPLEDLDGDSLTGTGTKNFHVHADPGLAEGFPLDLQGDGAASPRFADLDSDGQDELVVATSNGEVHAYRARGGEAEGWPVFTADAQINYGAPAYGSGEITTPIRAAVLRSPAIGDVDRDGDLEVFVGDFQGRISGFDHRGEPLSGFPVRSSPLFSSPQRPDRNAGFYAAHPELVPGDYPGAGALPNDPDVVPDLVNRRDKVNRTIWWFLAAPSLGNIDPTDDDLEIIAGASDRHLYAWRSDGTELAGWPVVLRDPAKLDASDRLEPVTHRLREDDSADRFIGAKVVTSPALGDLDGDGDLEVLSSVNEQYLEPPNSDAILPEVVSLINEVGNNRVYALDSRGTLAPGAPASNHPHSNAYLGGWPARITTAALELLPVVGNGPNGSPVLGDVDGDGLPEIGVHGNTGPAYVLNGDGDSIYGKDVRGRDLVLSMESIGAGANSQDTPVIPAVGGPIFTSFTGAGLSLAVPTAGAGKLLDVVLPEDQLLSDNQLSVWETRTGARAQLPAFPREVNDLMFLATAASADVDGDGAEELLMGSAYSDLHAFNLFGEEPGLRSLSSKGWPKFTAGWTVGPPAVGDFDGDGERDVAHSIREGSLFVWMTGGGACSAASWPEFGHDPWNTNNIHTDALAPSRTRDLRAVVLNNQNARLSFTAPGDDGLCGKVHHYEVRASASPLTEGNFAAAPAFGDSPPPASGGSSSSWVIDRPRCDLYLAFRAWDADPSNDTAAHPANASAISNVVLVHGFDPTC